MLKSTISFVCLRNMTVFFSATASFLNIFLQKNKHVPAVTQKDKETTEAVSFERQLTVLTIGLGKYNESFGAFLFGYPSYSKP